MKKLNYVTGNKKKFNNAQIFFKKRGIKLIQKKIEIYEIQGLDAVAIAKSKAEQAWQIIKEPLFVNDAYWIIPALKGFPGPYMKYINAWFTPQDIINLMRGKSDRRIILRDTIVYINNEEIEVFTNDHEGIVLKSIYCGEYGNPTDAVISLSESGKSIAEEMKNKGFFLKGEDVVWNNFVDWLKMK